MEDCLLPTLVRCLMCEGIDFEDTPLMVESFSKEMQNSPRVLQEKEPGGEGGCISEPILRAHTLCLLILCPTCSPHCSITTGCSHKGARANARLIGVKLTNSKRHVPAGRTLLSDGACMSGDMRSFPITIPRHTHDREATAVPGLRVHLDHPVLVALPVPVLIQPVG